MVQFVINNIVYLWFFPVVLQIVLPLALLIVFLSKRVIVALAGKRQPVAEAPAEVGLKPAVRAA